MDPKLIDLTKIFDESFWCLSGTHMLLIPNDFCRENIDHRDIARDKRYTTPIHSVLTVTSFVVP